MYGILSGCPDWIWQRVMCIDAPLSVSKGLLLLLAAQKVVEYSAFNQSTIPDQVHVKGLETVPKEINASNASSNVRPSFRWQI
jgi:hypothetical protein